MSPFINAMQKNRLPHAMLFLGDDQAAKEQCALDLAAGLFCEKKVIPFGCRVCTACGQILEKRHLQVRYLWPNSSAEIKIDQIRDLIESTGEPSWIIPRAECLNKQASNALLKTLEEPRKKQIFILIAPTAGFLLPTLVSRCQRIFFKNNAAIADALKAPKIPERMLERLELAESLIKEKVDLNLLFLAWRQNAPAGFQEALLEAQADLKKHVNPQLVLETLLLSEKS